jgi:hypothetical protein
MYSVNFIHFILVINFIYIIDVIFTHPQMIHLIWKLSGPVKPQPVVPLAMLFPGYLSIPSCSIEAEVPKVLL